MFCYTESASKNFIKARTDAWLCTTAIGAEQEKEKWTKLLETAHSQVFFLLKICENAFVLLLKKPLGFFHPVFEMDFHILAFHRTFIVCRLFLSFLTTFT